VIQTGCSTTIRAGRTSSSPAEAAATPSRCVLYSKIYEPHIARQFLPTIGQYVLAAINRSLPAEMHDAWSFTRFASCSSIVGVKERDFRDATGGAALLEDMATQQDLLA
jgi:hypothetical protein